MGKVTYSQIADMLSFYLFRYPSIQVAIECVLEDIDDGENPEICESLNEVSKEIDNGKDEAEALLELAQRVASKNLEDFVLKIIEGKEKKKDIGFFVKGINPEDYMKNKPPYKKHGGKKKKTYKK